MLDLDDSVAFVEDGGVGVDELIGISARNLSCEFGFEA